MSCREDGGVGEHTDKLARNDIYLRNSVYLVIEKLDPKCLFTRIRREDFNAVAADSEFVTHKIYVVSVIADGDKVADKCISVLLHTRTDSKGKLLVFLGVTQAVNAGNAGNDDDISPLKQGRCRAVTELVYLVINHCVLFDINILAGNISLGLIIIIIRNKIFNRVFGEKFTELTAKLCGKCFVMSKDKGRAVDSCDYICHGKCLTRACNAEQGLIFQSRIDACGKLFYSLRLISRGFIVRD